MDFEMALPKMNTVDYDVMDRRVPLLSPSKQKWTSLKRVVGIGN